ncbi:MAG: hypothetical protein ACUVXJ_18855 [Phycisphaerae bacterium]
MKIISIRKIEDCFDGSGVYGYVFDVPWTAETIELLRSLGPVDYFSDFPRPFFRLRTKCGCQVKGVEGDCECRAIYPRDEREVARHEFERLFDRGASRASNGLTDE